MCYPLTKAYNSNKMQSESTPCIFLGYSQTQNAYKCLNTHSKKLYIPRNVVFDESQHSLSMSHSSFPHTSLSPPTVQPGLVPASSMSYHALCPPPNLMDDVHAIVAFPLGNSASSHHFASLDSADTPSNHTSFPDTLSSLPPSSTPQLESSSHQFIPLPRLHPMRTRSMNQIFKPKQIFFITKHPISLPIKPTSVREAISQPHWREAMFAKLTAFMKHDTWDLIPPPSQCHPVGCKWVFRVKRKPDGSIDRFKARQVAKGYNQHPGLEYKETFNPVVKLAIIRITIVVLNGWSMRQMDTNNAFLNGRLTDDVYMMQPSGFKDASRPHHVCRLKRLSIPKTSSKSLVSNSKNAI